MQCTARTTGQDSKGALTKGLKNDKAVFPVDQMLMLGLLALIINIDQFKALVSFESFIKLKSFIMHKLN